MRQNEEKGEGEVDGSFHLGQTTVSGTWSVDDYYHLLLPPSLPPSLPPFAFPPFSDPSYRSCKSVSSFFDSLTLLSSLSSSSSEH